MHDSDWSVASFAFAPLCTFVTFYGSCHTYANSVLNWIDNDSLKWTFLSDIFILISYFFLKTWTKSEVPHYSSK